MTLSQAKKTYMAKVTPMDILVDAPIVVPYIFTDDPKYKYKCACGALYNGKKCPKGTEEDPHEDRTENPPKKTLPMQLKHPSTLDTLAVASVGAEMIQKYVTGTGQPGQKGYEPPKVLMGAFGRPVPMSVQSCQVGAMLFKCQVPENPGEMYTFEEICQFMLSDSMCEQMYVASMEIQVEEDDESPLAPSAEV